MSNKENKDPEEVLTIRQGAEEMGVGWQTLRIMLLRAKLPKGWWWKNGPYPNSPIRLLRKCLSALRTYPDTW